MSLNIQECQRNSVIQMLSSSKRDDSLFVWKILVFDKKCQDFLSPLLKVGSLRQHGVTLHLRIETKRTPIPDVPAVYLVGPSKENIDAIVKDLRSELYASISVNFSTSVSSEMLKYFARQVAGTGLERSITSVNDKFIDFVSMSSTEFNLNLPESFRILQATNNDSEIENLLQSTSDGLLCVIITLGVLPIIRCPNHPSSPARTVALDLHEKLKKLLSERGLEHSSSRPFGFSISSGMILQKPVLVIEDRHIDLVSPLKHTNSYQGLIHDLLGIRLNRVVISKEGQKSKVLDLDDSDELWNEIASKPFPEAATAISDAVQAYTNKKDSFDSKNTSSLDESGLSSTLNNFNLVPEMISRKRFLDIHTNIAHSIVTSIKERSLNKFYEIEDGFETTSVAASLARLETIIDAPDKGTNTDKLRALICLYLVKSKNLTEANLVRIRQLIKQLGEDHDIIDILQQLKVVREKSDPLTPVSPGSNAPTSQNQSNWSSSWIDRSKELLQGVKNLLPLKRSLVIGEILETLMEPHVQGGVPGSNLDEAYLYLDPRSVVQLGIKDEDVPRMKTSFTQGIVFIVGGGTFCESRGLKDFAAKSNKQILYGSTDFPTSSEFVDYLKYLVSHPFSESISQQSIPR